MPSKKSNGLVFICVAWDVLDVVMKVILHYRNDQKCFFFKVGKYVVSSFVFLAFLGISGSQWKEWGGEGSIVMPQPSAVALTHNPFRPRKKNRFQHATNDTERKKERKKEKEQKERPRDRAKRTDAALSLRVDNLVGCPVIKVVIVRFAYLLSLSLSALLSFFPFVFFFFFFFFGRIYRLLLLLLLFQ